MWFSAMRHGVAVDYGFSAISALFAAIELSRWRRYSGRSGVDFSNFFSPIPSKSNPNLSFFHYFFLFSRPKSSPRSTPPEIDLLAASFSSPPHSPRLTRRVKSSLGKFLSSFF
ncbi:hypothetical protein LIER_03532 [Lithospermum erythrorhizon]|uniref:Uncharacterized protein n=1 Tax=Lithospermum erythrorhizon TaxID=34254 RepID=A0AAV3NTF2_LITER